MGKLNGTEKVTALLKKCKSEQRKKSARFYFFIHDASFTESVYKSNASTSLKTGKNGKIKRLSRPAYDDCIVRNIIMTRFKPCENP